MVEAEEELVCIGLHSMVTPVFSVENEILYKRSVIFTCIYSAILWANSQELFSASIKWSVNSYLERHRVPLKLLGIGGVIP